MSRSKFILLNLFFIFFGNNCFAIDYFYVFGVGESNDSKVSSQDYPIQLLKPYLKSNPKMLFSYSIGGVNKEHFDNFERTFRDFQTENVPFTSKNYQLILESIKMKMQTGALTSKDHLLIEFVTHGAEKKAANKGIGHTITTTDGKVEMDLLKEITKLAKLKNIDMAIVDQSCFSGATLSLANENVCVISGSGEFNEGWNGETFSARFSKNLKKGLSLEEVFLESRSTYSDYMMETNPEISTPEGLQTYKEIYQNYYPYINSSSNTLDEFILVNPDCLALDPLKHLDWIANWAQAFNPMVNKIIKGSNIPIPLIQKEQISNFTEKLFLYHDTLNKLKFLNNYLTSIYYQKEYIVHYGPNGIKERKFNFKNIINFSPDPNEVKTIAKKRLELQTIKNPSKELLDWIEWGEVIDEVNKIRDTINSGKGEFETYILTQEKIKTLKKELTTYAKELVPGEIALYNSRYLSLAQKKNPQHICRRFKL
jgi:hypothetical protein